MSDIPVKTEPTTSAQPTRTRAAPNASAAQRRRARSPPATDIQTTTTTSAPLSTRQQPNRPAARTTFQPAAPVKQPSTAADRQLRASTSEIAQALTTGDGVAETDVKSRIIERQADLKQRIKREPESDDDIMLPSADAPAMPAYTQPITLPFKSVSDVEVEQMQTDGPPCPPGTVGRVIQSHHSNVDDTANTTVQPKLLLFQLPTALPVPARKMQSNQQSSAAVSAGDMNVKQENAVAGDETILKADINDIADDVKSSKQVMHDNLVEASTYSHITEYRPDDLRLYQNTPDNQQYRISEVNSGYLGQLMVYKSGRTVMKIGVHEYDLHTGVTGAQHFQHAVAIDKDTQKYIPIAPVQHTLVASLNV